MLINKGKTQVQGSAASRLYIASQNINSDNNRTVKFPHIE